MITQVTRSNGVAVSWEESGEYFTVTRNARRQPLEVIARQGKWETQEAAFTYSPDGEFLGMVGQLNTAMLSALISEAQGIFGATSLKAAEFAGYAGILGEVVEVTDLPGRPQYRWDGLEFRSVGPTTDQHAALHAAMGMKRQAMQQFATPVIERFASVADWTITNGGTGVAAAKAGGTLGENCINLQTPASAGQSTYITQDQSIDLNAQNGFWLVTRNNYRQPTAGVGLTTYLSHQTGMGSGAGRWSNATIPPARAVSVQPHWIPKSAFSVLDGAPNFANPILSWRFRLDSHASEQRDLDLLGVLLGGQRPTVIITFDDGWSTSYSNAHVQARKREIPLVHYLIASKIGAGGYITAAQAREMVAAGDQLGLHGFDRWDQDVTRVASDHAALTALLGDVADFDHAAYPEGQIGDGTTWQTTEAALQAVGVKTARLAGATGEPTLLGYSDPLTLTSYPLNNTLSLANAQAAVDTAIASGGTTIFYGHKIDAVADNLTWATTDWTTLLDYIVTKRNAGSLDVKTMQQWYDGSA